jgi:uncharacterized RDD family membrane protein YckC
MSDVNWTRYEFPLTPPSQRDIRPTVAPAARPPSKGPVDPRPLAGRGERLIAALMDLFVLAVAFSVPLLTATALGYPIDARWVRLIVVSAVLAVEIVQMVLLSVRGQTLGKLLMGLRIVSHRDGSNPGFLRAVLMRRVLPGMVAAVPCVGKVFVLVDCFAIFGDECRCYHDLFADTRVVRDE